MLRRRTNKHKKCLIILTKKLKKEGYYVEKYIVSYNAVKEKEFTIKTSDLVIDEDH